MDLMDEGTDARDVLENKLLPLRRGRQGTPLTHSTAFPSPLLSTRLVDPDLDPIHRLHWGGEPEPKGH